MRKFISAAKFILIPLAFLSVVTFVWLIPIHNSYTQTPPPKREMRAVWISTYMNIDWPSTHKITVQQQKDELIKQLDLHKANGMNAIIFQIRPCADAFYESKIEMWSQWLTGTQGKAPSPTFDPLQFAIEECRKRNMELHAWINPFRAVGDTARLALVDSLHISKQKKKKDWFHIYGKTVYFDPGIPEVRKYITSIICDVVKRYDVDAIHFDDYFYPYKLAGQEFADSLTWKKYKNGFTKKQRAEWRRNNTDLFIQAVSDSIKRLKPWVKFGISPFGVYRNIQDDPNGSDTRAGHPCYDVLFADILKWLKNGWIDYVTPQLYWNIGYKPADFKVLIEWWRKNTYGKQLYIGHGIFKIDKASQTPEWQSSDQILQQIELTRNIAEIGGSMFFSSKTFLKNPDEINEKFQENVYPTPALVPQMPWIDKTPPSTPTLFKVKKSKDGFLLTWQTPETKKELDKVRYYIIYRFEGKTAGNTNDPAHIFKIVQKPEFFIENKRSIFSFFHKRYTYVVTAVDRMSNESVTSKQIILRQKLVF